MKLEYDVVEGLSFGSFISNVNEAIESGWKPIGGIGLRGDALYQAMVKETESSDDIQPLIKPGVTALYWFTFNGKHYSTNIELLTIESLREFFNMKESESIYLSNSIGTISDMKLASNTVLSLAGSVKFIMVTTPIV